MKKLIAILTTALLVSPALYGSEETKTKKDGKREECVTKSRCQCEEGCTCEATKCSTDCKDCRCEKKKDR